MEYATIDTIESLDKDASEFIPNDPLKGCTSAYRIGALRWSAPEVISDGTSARPTSASDVWSFGCTAYEILTGKVPYYQHLQHGPIIRDILCGAPPPWPKDDELPEGTSHIPEFVMGFVNDRWKLNPEERGEMNKIVMELKSSELRLFLKHQS